MSQDEIYSLTRSMPFVPFRVTVSNGEEYDVYHPDMIMPTPDSVFVARSNANDPDKGLRGVFVSMLHIVKIEKLSKTPAPPKSLSTV